MIKGKPDRTVLIVGEVGSEANRRAVEELKAAGFTARELSIHSNDGKFEWSVYADGRQLEPPLFIHEARGFCNVDSLVEWCEEMGVAARRKDEPE